MITTYLEPILAIFLFKTMIAVWLLEEAQKSLKLIFAKFKK
jgi:hypothetical protein